VLLDANKLLVPYWQKSLFSVQVEGCSKYQADHRYPSFRRRQRPATAKALLTTAMQADAGSGTVVTAELPV
jgi:hypothetical protein